MHVIYLCSDKGCNSVLFIVQERHRTPPSPRPILFKIKGKKSIRTTPISFCPRTFFVGRHCLTFYAAQWYLQSLWYVRNGCTVSHSAAGKGIDLCDGWMWTIGLIVECRRSAAASSELNASEQIENGPVLPDVYGVVCTSHCTLRVLCWETEDTVPPSVCFPWSKVPAVRLLCRILVFILIKFLWRKNKILVCLTTMAAGRCHTIHGQ